MADDVATASVLIEGVETAANAVLVDVEDDDRLIDKATIVYDDAGGLAAATVLEQRQVVVELGWPSERAKLFEGLVWRVKTEARADGPGSGQRVTVVALDVSWRLHQKAAKPRVHPPGKLSDLLRAIVAPYQLQVGQIKLDPDPEFTAEAPLLQGPLTDWAFIQELAVRYGARAFVEVNDDVPQFYFVSQQAFLDGDGMGEIVYAPGAGPLLSFTYQRLATAAAPVRSAVAVDPLTGDPVVQAAAPPPPEAPLAVDPDQQARLDATGLGNGKAYGSVVDAMAGAAGQAEDARAKEFVAGVPSDPALAALTVAQDPTCALGLVGHGVAIGTVQLRAKGKLRVDGIAPWAVGDWYVRRVNHRYTRGAAASADPVHRAAGVYRTHFVVTR